MKADGRETSDGLRWTRDLVAVRLTSHGVGLGHMESWESGGPLLIQVTLDRFVFFHETLKARSGSDGNGSADRHASFAAATRDPLAPARGFLAE